MFAKLQWHWNYQTLNSTFFLFQLQSHHVSDCHTARWHNDYFQSIYIFLFETYLKSSLRKFYGLYGDLIKHYEVPSPNCCMTFWDMVIYSDILNWSDRHYTNFWTYHRTGPYYQFWPYCQISGGFHRTLLRVRLANRERFLLRTPGPVPFGTCVCSNVETILSWTCHVYGPFEFRTSLGTSVLIASLQVMYHLSCDPHILSGMDKYIKQCRRST